jgi:hypothetical protein
MWGRRRNGLTDNFTLAVYMQFLVAADMTVQCLCLTLWYGCRIVPIVPTSARRRRHVRQEREGT